ncbi:MAG: putative lipopolysaccharide heptosyltransferase III [Deltaproteobacteria bacterium]
MKEFKDVEKILVMKLRHIGDVLLCVPAIRAIRESFPNAHIAALVNSGTEEMLALNPLLDEVICYKRGMKKLFLVNRMREEIRFIKELKAKGFDMTVDLTGGDRAALTGFFIGARYRLAYDMKGSGFLGKRRLLHLLELAEFKTKKSGFFGKRWLYTHLAPKPKPMTHAVLRDLGLVNAFGMDTQDLSVDIYADPADDAYIENVLKASGLQKDEPFVHVHPTSRWLFKAWQDSSMAWVLDKIEDAGLRVVITASDDEAELNRVKSIIGLMKTKPIDLSGRLKLNHLASLSKRAAFYFGIDTAPMHIAAAVGTRVVAVFGPSGSFDWGPWDNAASRRLRIRDNKKGYRQISSPYRLKNGVQVNGIHTVIQKDWTCVPCGKAGCENTQKSRCLDELEKDAVWKVLSKVIEGMGRSIAR